MVPKDDDKKPKDEERDKDKKPYSDRFSADNDGDWIPDPDEEKRDKR